MKTVFIYFSFFYLLPTIIAAQPTLSKNEFYHAGDVIQMIRCDATGLNAGSAGANVTWDFATVGSAGAAVTRIFYDTVVGFPTSNVLQVLPDGRKMHVQQNNTDSYVNAIVDAESDTIAYYNFYDIAKRPFTYNSSYLDSYKVNIPAAVTNGQGTLLVTGDAYGTITLPTGTFTNVLRIRKFQTDIDTIGSAPTISFTTSYLWFDTVHSAPLFRMDSTVSLFGNTQTTMYLSGATSVTGITSGQHVHNCYLQNNMLTITGDFDNGKLYDVVVYSIIGSVMFRGEFTGGGSYEQFEMTRKLSPGIYIVSIAARNDPSSGEKIKVISQ